MAVLYGSGLRLAECCRLRMRDVDFARDQITVRDGKGRKDRNTLLPARLRQPLREQVDRVARQHAGRHRCSAAASSPMPSSLATAGWRTTRDLPWQWLFPGQTRQLDRATAELRRSHLHENLVQREFAIALRAAGIVKPATCHTPAPLVRHPPLRVRLRHPHDPGAARPQGRRHDLDLHSLPERPPRPPRPEPPR